MMRPDRKPQSLNPRDEAIAWLAREREGRLTPDQQIALQAWLDADPSHAAIYARARAAVEAPTRFAAHPELMDMRASALGALKERPPYRRMIAAAAAVVLSVAVGAGWVTLSPSTSPQVSRLQEAAAPILPALDPNAAIYRTAVGERTSVKLPDGSVAILNTDTLLKVAYTGRERGVRLVRGQAMFEVAHNKRVPFQVYAGDRRVTAVGTVFDVRLDASKVKVTLVEGVVRVATLAPKQAEAPAQQVIMTAGEELQAGPTTLMSVKAADVGAETSWKAGVVVFKAETLAQAAAEVNRYTDRPVRLADASIADYRITGVFKTGDPDHFAKGVAEILPVRAETQPDGSLLLSAK